MLLPTLLITTTFLTPLLAQGAGQANLYDGPIAVGSCSFTTYTPPSPIRGAAISAAHWDNSAHCGKCVRVVGPIGSSIIAMIVDKCPGCPPNGLDLLADGFAQLADPAVGRIDVTWEFVRCPIESPLQLHLKDGSSAWWFGAQVVGANKGVSDVQYSTDGGSTWQGGLVRMDYNFFKKEGGCGQDHMDAKVISADGEEVIIHNVGVTSENIITAEKNFS